MTNEVTHFIEQAISNTLLPLPAQPEQPIRIDANPFLLVRVRRSHLLKDCLSQLSKYTPQDFKRPLVVQFEGEEGLDEGGLRKEFFGLVAQAIVDPAIGLFKPDEETRLVWFAPDSKEAEATYRLLGILVGMAIYNGCLIDLPFPIALYKKLLGLQLTLDDLIELQPMLGKNLKLVSRFFFFFFCVYLLCVSFWH